jgi:hypothetical protein
MKAIIEDDVGQEPPLPPGFKPSPYAEATSVTPIAGSDNDFAVDIKRDWCIVMGTSICQVPIQH